MDGSEYHDPDRMLFWTFAAVYSASGVEAGYVRFMWIGRREMFLLGLELVLAYA